MSDSQIPNEVAVLGCGNMGSAFVRALLAADKKVAAWNRTPARAEALADAGADVHTDANSAVAASAVTIICVGGADDVREVITAVGPETFGDRLVINVTSGTPEQARELAGWATSQGLRYLDAAILAYPEQIGEESTRLLVAGSEELWDQQKDLIFTLGGSSAYTGSDFGSAAVVDTGLIGSFYFATLVAFVEATRYVTSAGVPHALISDLLGDVATTLPHQLRLILGRIEADDFATDEATLQVYAAAAQSFSAAMDADGKAPVARLTAEILQKGIDAGLGELDLAAIVKL